MELRASPVTTVHSQVAQLGPSSSPISKSPETLQGLLETICAVHEDCVGMLRQLNEHAGLPGSGEEPRPPSSTPGLLGRALEARSQALVIRDLVQTIARVL